MRSKGLILLTALLFCLLISNSDLLAQSKDRNNPTPLQSRVISGFTSPIGTVYWYKLSAGPGELIIEMQVVGTEAFRGTKAAGVRFLMYDKDTTEVMNEPIWAVGKAEHKNKSLRLQNKQDFLLAIGLGEKMNRRDEPGATYMIRFKGAIDLPPNESE